MHRARSTSPELLRHAGHVLRLPHSETDAAPVIDYVDDDPSLLEQPDVGAQEPDATAGAYYYVETADDQE